MWFYVCVIFDAIVLSDVNKDLGFKAKDLGFKAKTKDLSFKAKDLSFKAKDLSFKAKDILSRPRTENLVLNPLTTAPLNITYLHTLFVI